MIARAALLVAATTTLAHADAADTASDPAVQDAAEANLETTSRNGLTFSASLGGGLIVGFGIEGSVGRGGSLTLRLGHAATRRTVITFEIGGSAAFHKVATMGATEANTNVNLMTGAQYYVNQSLWLRIAGGAGIYTQRGVTLSSGQPGNVTLAGPAILGGLGVELLRFHRAVLGIEFGTSAMVNRDGLLIASTGGLALAFD